MKFIIEILVSFVGLVLLVTTVITTLAIVGYFQGASGEDLWSVLRFSVPVMLVSFVIAWRNRQVLREFFAWAFPPFW